MTSQLESKFKSGIDINISDSDYDPSDQNLLNPNQKRSMMDIPMIVEKFPIEEISQPNLRTIFAIWNTMIGTGTFIVPSLVHKAGLIPAFITLTVLYLINLQTCIIISSTTKYASDFNDIVYRYGGNTMRQVWVFSCFLICFLVSQVQAIIMSQTSQNLVGLVIDVQPLVPGDLDFQQDNWNILQNSLLVFAIAAQFLFIKDIGIVQKIASIGSFIVILSMTWFAYNFVTKVDIAAIEWGPIMIGRDPAALVGPMITGFMVHPSIMPIIRSNQGFSHIKTNVICGFTLVQLTYLFCGLLGYFAFQQKTGYTMDSVLNVPLGNNFFLECYTNLVRVLVSIQQMTVLPLLAVISRNMFFNIVYDNEPEDIDPGKSTVFNIVFLAGGIALAIFQPFLGKILSQAGSIIGIIITPVIPILVWTCKKQFKRETFNKIDLKIYHQMQKNNNIYKEQLKMSFVHGNHNKFDQQYIHARSFLNISIVVLCVLAAAQNLQATIMNV